MVAQKHTLMIQWDDPQLRQKTLQFFLDVYRERQELQRQRSGKQAAPDEPPNPESHLEWHLGLDNLPEEYLSKDHFLWLNNVLHGINTLLDLPLQNVTDGRTAARVLMTIRILSEARRFILAIFYFLMLDKRLHPGSSVCVDAVSLLGIGKTKDEENAFYDVTFSLCLSQKVYDILWQPRPSDESFEDALKILHKCGDLYFTTLGSIFPVCAIGKCHRAFNLFMEKIGTTAMEERVKNYIRRRKTMQCEIEAWVQRNGHIDQMATLHDLAFCQEQIRQLGELVNASIEKNTHVVANMDRRLRDFIKYVRLIISGFVKLFRPTKPKPTPEQIANTLMPPDRYACLEHVKEPHRSQIKAVIDYTYRHPIVYEQKKSDDYTLAWAVRDVWKENQTTWSFAEGTFATAEDLKSACYNIRKGPHDPFNYVI